MLLTGIHAGIPPNGEASERLVSAVYVSKAFRRVWLQDVGNKLMDAARTFFLFVTGVVDIKA